MDTTEATRRFAISVRQDFDHGTWEWSFAGPDYVWSGSVPARDREDAIVCAIAQSAGRLTAHGGATLSVSLPPNARLWALSGDIAACYGGLRVEPYTSVDEALRRRAMAGFDRPTLGPWPELIVATDGAARRGCVGWGWLAADGRRGWGSERPSERECDPRTHPLVAELRAISAAIRALPGRGLVIRTDSKAAQAYVKAWLRGSHRMPAGYHSEHHRSAARHGLGWMQEQVRCEAGRIRIEWVHGHCGDPLNEGADSLAKLARRYREGTWGFTAEEIPDRAASIAEVFTKEAKIALAA